MNKRMKSVLSLLLALVMIALTLPQQAIATQDGNTEPSVRGTAQLSGGKEEIVYANLLGNGNVNNIYVVNRFEVSAAGALTDYGDYTEVKNLTSTKPITQNSGVVTMQANPGSFYYQGTVSKKHLPWTFHISYYLNGTEMDADKIAGQNGNLEIKIRSQYNEAFDENFKKQFMLQISLTLDAEKCRDITSDGATIANAGKNKAVVHTVLPGKDADILVAATVRDFTMPGIEIAAIPFSTPIEIPDTDEMLDDMTTLTDAISKLNDGVRDLQTGVTDLHSGVGDLASGSAEYADGVYTLNDNSGKLTSGSAAIKSALATIASSLNGSGGGEGMDLGELTELPIGLRQMATGLGSIATALTQLRDGYDTMLAALDGAMNIPSVSEDDIVILGMAVATMTASAPEKAAAQQALDNLLASYSAAQKAQGTYGSIRNELRAVSGGLTVIVEGDGTAENPGLKGIVSGLNMLAGTIEDALSASDMMTQIQQLAKGIATLSEQYSQFHAGLIEYTDGVADLASGYGELHDGLLKLGEGTDELDEGVRDLYEGTTELKEETDDLPDTIQVEIDKLMKDYDVGEYTPVAFTSPRNTNISNVQFVIMTAPIKLPDEPEITDSQVKETTPWDRFLDLFR